MIRTATRARPSNAMRVLAVVIVAAVFIMHGISASASASGTTEITPPPPPRIVRGSSDPKLLAPVEGSVWKAGQRYRVEWNATFREPSGAYYNPFTRLNIDLYRHTTFLRDDKFVQRIAADFPMSLGSLLWTVPTEVDASGKGANSSSKMKPVGDDERDAIYYLRAYPSYFLWPREEGGCERCLEDVPLGARFSIRTKDCTDACMVGVEPPIANADVLLGEVDPRAVNPFLLPPVAQPASATSGSVPGLTHNSNLDIMRSVGVGVGVTAFFAFVVAFFVYSKKAKRGWERFSQRGAYAVAARKSSVGGAGSGSGSVAGTVASTPSPSDGDAATIDITDALMMDGATIVEPRTSSLSATASPADIKRRSSRLNSTMSVVAPSPLRQCVTLLKTPSTRTAASSDDGDRLSTASSSGDATPADGAATRTSSISEAAGVTGSSLPQHDGMARMLDVEDNENDYDSGDLSSRAYLRTPTPDHMLSPNAPPPTANVSPVATDLLGTMAASTSAINNSTAILLGNTFRNALRIASGISEDGREIHVRSASVASSATGTSESDGRLALGDDNEHEDEREDHDESTRRTMTTSTATMNQRSPGSESLLSHALGSESSSAGSRTTGGSSPLLSGLAWPEVEQHQSRTLRDDGDTSDGESV